MDLDLQTKLLRFIQTGSFQKVGSNKTERVDVRFICATNKDPLAEVKAGNFREDLFYRLHVIPIHLPPLRERGGDVSLILNQLLQQYAQEEQKQFSGFDNEAQASLFNYEWPGNVRQLQNVIRNIVVLNTGGVISPDMLPPPLNDVPIPEMVPNPANEYGVGFHGSYASIRYQFRIVFINASASNVISTNCHSSIVAGGKRSH